MKIDKENFFFLFTAFASVANAKFVSDISECPPLSPRSPPESVHDLRPDDIKVIGALGDRYRHTFICIQ